MVYKKDGTEALVRPEPDGTNDKNRERASGVRLRTKAVGLPPVPEARRSQSTASVWNLQRKIQGSSN